MAIEAAQYVSANLESILTGLTMAVLGIGVYEARDGFFLFRRSFQGKIGALIIFILTLFTVSLFAPMIGDFWESALPNFDPAQIIGIVLGFGMVGVNKAAEWNYTDPKSLIVYGISILFYIS